MRLPFATFCKRTHPARPNGDNRANRGRPHGFAHRLESAPGVFDRTFDKCTPL